jgi:hypothetical protein
MLGWLLVSGVGVVLAACGSSGGPTSVNTAANVVKVSLASGQSLVASPDGKILELDIPAAPATGAEYRLAVQSASQTAGATTSMELAASAPGVTASMSPSASEGLAAASSEWPGTPPRWVQRDRWETGFRQRVRELLLRSGAIPAGRSGGGLHARAALLGGGAPTVGDTLHFKFAIKSRSSGTLTCQPDSSVIPGGITAIVRQVGQRAIFAADTGDSGDFTGTQYQTLSDAADQYIVPVDSAYFGAPADLDGNGHVIVLFTRQVNLLTPRGSSTFEGGFFVPVDLADSAGASGCATSNEAELVYLLAPDPAGAAGDTISETFAFNNAIDVTGHELSHMIRAEDRIIKGGGTFSDLEDTWLDEGLAHLAEEVIGFAYAGRSVRQDLDFQDIRASQRDLDAFNDFQIDNFSRLAYYMMNPNGTEVLTTSDPGGVTSLRFRGFAWMFLRWLGDQYGPSGSGIVSGSDEQLLFQRIATGGSGHEKGIQNILDAIQTVDGTSVTWDSLMADFSIMPAVDDTTPDLASSRQEEPSWNLPDLYGGLNGQLSTYPPFAKPYPLAVTSSGFVSGTFDFDVDASAAKYFSFSASGSAPDLTLKLTDASGGALPPSAAAQVTIVRIR